MIHCDITGRSRVRMTGHADLGHELVCAAASALASTFVESLEAIAGIPDEKIEIKIESGLLDVDLKDAANEVSDYMIRYFALGMKGLARTYPKLVRVNERRSQTQSCV